MAANLAALGGPSGVVGGGRPTGGNLVLNQETEQLKRDLDTYKARCEILTRRNTLLEDKIGSMDRDSLDVIGFLRKDAQRNDELVEIMKIQAREKEEQMQQELEDQRFHHTEVIQEMEAKYEKNDKMLNELLKQALLDKGEADKYLAEKEAQDKKIEEFTNMITAMQTEHSKEKELLQYEFSQEKAQMDLDMEKKERDITETLEKSAKDALSASVKKIFSDNSQLAEELRIQCQEADRLTVQNKQLTESNKALRRDISLREGLEHETMKKMHHQSKEITDLNNKIKALERSLSQILHEWEAERRKGAKEHAKQLEVNETDIAGLKQLLRLKNREMRNIKRLAAALVEQRSEVEQYFLDALEDCKTEIRKRRREQEYNEGTGRSRAPSPGISTGSRFPPIPSDKTMGTDDSQRSIGADAAAARVDIADLTWEDKERVLRLLFARINRATGRPATSDVLEQQAEPLPQSDLFSNTEIPYNTMNMNDQSMGAQMPGLA